MVLWAWVQGIGAHYGLAGTVLVGIAAVAYFLPPLRKDCIWAAAVVFTAGAIYTLGVHDEAKFCKAQDTAVVVKSEAAHADAVKRVERPSPGPLGLRLDRYDRDGKKH